MDSSLILKSHDILNLMDFEDFDDDYSSDSSNLFKIIPEDYYLVRQNNIQMIHCLMLYLGRCARNQ